jgi:hypothetical protein
VVLLRNSRPPPDLSNAQIDLEKALRSPNRLIGPSVAWTGTVVDIHEMEDGRRRGRVQHLLTGETFLFLSEESVLVWKDQVIAVQGKSLGIVIYPSFTGDARRAPSVEAQSVKWVTPPHAPMELR